MPPLPSEPYLVQLERWPASGRHILAQFDAESVIVYQAYRRTIGLWAIEHGELGGPEFSFSRMSWIKPNFLWMMYRSGWGTKEGQEVTLALRIRRSFFERLLEAAVPSTHWPELHATRQDWQAAVDASDVRLQWDPDHAPGGNPVDRRAVQLGLRGAALRELAGSALLEVIDMSAFVAEQRVNARAARLPNLLTPREHVYDPGAAAAVRVGAST